MYLASRDQGKVRFCVDPHYLYNNQNVEGSEPLPGGEWIYIAVTLFDRLCTLYLNGTTVGTREDFTMPPVQLGATSLNWIGRSQADTDPFLGGKIDDFRIYNGALSAEEVGELAKD